MVYAIVTHTDIDGVASAALYLYLNNNPEYRVFFTEPFMLYKALDKVASAYYERVAIFDLGINSRVYDLVLEYINLLRRSGIQVSWFDHHVWDSKWVNDIAGRGVELYLDHSTCATGVVAKYVRPIRANIDTVFVENLVKGVCAGDLWRFDHWLGGYYVRVVRRGDKDSWRKTVLKVLASGVLWSSEFNDKVVEHVDSELRYFTQNLRVVTGSVGGLKLAVAESNEYVENSFLASYLIGRLGADIVVLVSGDGKLSFRSRNFDVREVAHALGGGGHKYAAGAKISLPWWVKMLSKIKQDALLHYTMRLVARKVGELA